MLMLTLAMISDGLEVIIKPARVGIMILAVEAISTALTFG